MKSLKVRASLVVMIIGLCIYQISTKPFNYGMDINGGSHLVVEVQTEHLEQDRVDDAIEGVQKVLKARIDDFILAESSVQRGADNRIVIQIPGIDTEKANRIKEIIKKEAYLEFRLVIDEPESV